MKRKIFLSIIAIAFTIHCRSQTNEEQVKTVLKLFQQANEKLDTTGTAKFFSDDSKIYESGGSEGTYRHYEEYHITPELSEFKSFTFSNYKIDVKIDLPFAFATEEYNYTIVLKEGDKTILRKGVCTSVLKKENDKWLITVSHNSSRK